MASIVSVCYNNYDDKQHIELLLSIAVEQIRHTVTVIMRHSLISDITYYGQPVIYMLLSNELFKI